MSLFRLNGGIGDLQDHGYKWPFRHGWWLIKVASLEPPCTTCRQLYYQSPFSSDSYLHNLKWCLWVLCVLYKFHKLQELCELQEPLDICPYCLVPFNKIKMWCTIADTYRNIYIYIYVGIQFKYLNIDAQVIWNKHRKGKDNFMTMEDMANC